MITQLSKSPNPTTRLQIFKMYVFDLIIYIFLNNPRSKSFNFYTKKVKESLLNVNKVNIYLSIHITSYNAIMHFFAEISTPAETT